MQTIAIIVMQTESGWVSRIGPILESERVFIGKKGLSGVQSQHTNYGVREVFYIDAVSAYESP